MATCLTRPSSDRNCYWEGRLPGGQGSQGVHNVSIAAFREDRKFLDFLPASQ